mgnify:CR=1 FL=1
MKKNIIYVLSILVSGLSFWSCEDTLDTTARPDNEISKIIVTLENEQGVDPNDDSGLAPAFSTFVDLPVTFSSSTPDNQVVERVWQVAQPQSASTLDFEEIMETGPVTRSFGRPNNTTVDGERFGFPIILTETRTNGDIVRLETQVQVRSNLTAAIIAPGIASLNEATVISAADAAIMGLEASDLTNPGQVTFEWDFGNGTIDTPDGPVSSTLSTDINQSFNVFFDTTTPQGSDGELVTLTVTRSFPSSSTSTAEKRIIVVDGLTPSRGAGRDAIKLSAMGNSIIVGYEEAVGDISVISATDFELSIDVTEITDATAAANISAITVTNVEIDPNDANNLLLTLSGNIPDILMDNVLITFNGRELMSQGGEDIVPFIDSNVFPTGRNLLESASGFEDQTASFVDGGFFSPNVGDNPELEFSMEQSFDGTTSMLFSPAGGTDLSSNGFIGLSIVENGLGTLPATEPDGDYVLSMWVYVESAESGMSVDFFLLDFAFFTTGVQTDSIPTGEWVFVSGIRNINAAQDIRSLIRVANFGNNTFGQGRIFVDQASIRVVDDGR